MSTQLTKERIEAVLATHNYSMTESSKYLGLPTSMLWDQCAKLGVRTGPPAKPFVEDTKSDLQKAIEIAESIIEMCSHCADFRNGNTHDGLDEGAVLASNFMYRAEQKLKELRDRNNL